MTDMMPGVLTNRFRDLTPVERITAAFMHYVRHIDQQDLAAMLGVNQGRVNEACLAIRKAAEAPKAVRKYGEKRHARKGR